MRRRLLPLMLVAGTVFALGCADGGVDPTGAELKKSQIPKQTAPQAQINKLINALFPQPDKAQAHALFSEVKDLLSDGDVELAQEKALELLDLATALLLSDALLHPDDEPRADAYTRFYELVREFVGLPEGTAAPVDPGAPGSAELPSGDATVDWQAGSVEETVVIKITRKEGDASCGFLIDNPQLGGCYDYTREPAGSFVLPVEVTACFDELDYEEPQLSRFLLHKSDDPTNPSAPVDALEPLDLGPGGGEPCFTGEVESASLESSGLANFARARWKDMRSAFAAVLGPQPLQAAAVAGAGKRLGGLSGSFTDIGAALPVQMDYEDEDDAERTAPEGATLPTTVRVTDVAGQDVTGAYVTFTVTEGAGSVGSTETTVATVDGIANAQWIIGSGLNKVEASGRGIGVHANQSGDGPFIPGPGETSVELGTGVLEFTAYSFVTVSQATVDVNNYHLQLDPGLMSGANFSGTDLLFSGALGYGNGTSAVYFYNSRTGLSEFSGTDIAVFGPGPGADHQTRNVMSEAPTFGQSTLGITTVRESFAFAGAPDDDYVIVRYTLFNQSGGAISNLTIGQIMDADVGTDITDDEVEYVSADGLARVSSPADTPAGFINLGAAVTNYIAYANPGSPLSPVDPATAADWFHFLTAGIVDPDLSFGPADIRHIMSHGTVAIPDGGSYTIGVALLGGADDADLAANAAAARAKYLTLPLPPTSP